MQRKKVSASESGLKNKQGGKKRKLNIQEPKNSPNGGSNSVNASESHKVPRALAVKFIVGTIFKNLSKIEEGNQYCSKPEEHFGMEWYIRLKHLNEHLGLFLHCQNFENDGNWSIDAEFDLKVVHPNGNSVTVNEKQVFDKYYGYGRVGFIKWEDLLEDYVVNDEVKVEAHVNFNKMTGVYKNNLRNFDETMSNFSNYVLIVKNEKFYVSKEFLAGHSLFFQTTLLGPVGGKKKPVYTLPGINSEDFQKYLEVLYGHATIDEVTVEGILSIADMYDTPVLVQKCEEFLLDKSTKTLRKKLEMSIRYKLEKLEKTCLSGIKTKDDILSVLPDDVSDLDQSILVNLFKKLLSFN